MNLIILGPPGAGKGTQAKILEANFGLIQISTGDLLRQIAARDSELGKSVALVMKEGKYVSDDLIIKTIDQRLSERDVRESNGFILDGFPRTEVQAQALEVLLTSRGQKIDYVIELEVDETQLIERISGRYTCAQCGEGYHDLFKVPSSKGKCDSCGSTQFNRRVDDNADALKKRLEAYRAQTKPIIPYYQKSGKYRKLDGMQEINDVAKQLDTLLKEKS